VNAFHVIGSVLALWALTLTFIGVRRDDFPRSSRQTFAVGAISVLLAAGAIGSAIITGALEDDEEGHAAEGKSAEGGGGGPGQLDLRADPSGTPKFDTDSLEAPAGRVTITMENPSPVDHNVTLEGDGHGETVGKGGTSTVSADLKPGDYAYYCSVPGHREAGMEGTLTVK
jgi:plastocyanin